jgi:DNA mismatch repair protein MutL
MVAEEGKSRSEEMISRGVGEKAFLEEKGPSSFLHQEILGFPSLRYQKEEGIMKVQDGERFEWEDQKKVLYPILGQIQGTYIICEGEGSLIFIDQHAAHERILFEKYKKEYETGSIVSERLLIPILIELSVEESHVLESNGDALRAVGFEIDLIGENLYAIRSMPSLTGLKDPKEMIRGILEEFSVLEKAGQSEEAIHTLLVKLACHSAIRGNFPLRREEMDKLIEQLIPFHFFTTCPHGRPIFFILPLDELKRQFKRK